MNPNGRPCYKYLRENDQIPPLHGTENNPKALARVKLFDPCGSWTWYVVEYDPTERLCYGLVDGFEKELGYFSMDELQAHRGKIGLPIERDLHFTPVLVSTLL